MDAQEYYQSLLAQGYKSEDSVAFTQQHYPGFTLAPTPEVNPSQMPFPAPVQMPGTSMGVGVGQTIVVGKSKGKAFGIISGSIGIVMSIAILVWTTQMVNAAISDNIDVFSDESGSPAETLVSALKTLQILSYLSIALLFGTIGISILTMLKKSKWWYLPAITFTILLLFVGMGYYTAISVNQYYHDEGCDSEIYSNCGDMKDESMWNTDVMLSGYCTGFALIFIGLLSLMSKPKSSPDESIEKEEVWVKAAWVIAIIVMVFGLLATIMVLSAFMNPIENNSSGNNYEFSARDDDSFVNYQSDNKLFHIKMDKGKSINPIQLQISINVDSGADMICESSEEYSDEIGCRYYLWSGDFDDTWGIDEEITIVEDGTDLCNVDSDFCEVVVILTNTIDGEELQRFTVYVY
jgi:hypothetical protein